jgi:DNA modification methylase
MKTSHIFRFENAEVLETLDPESIDLVVTSPPYPMIEMWDNIFSLQDVRIGEALINGNPAEAFHRMHALLFEIWRRVYRVLKPGGLACINIGDAVRSFNHDFSLFSNHAQILRDMSRLGFTPLPDILWRKQTNAPNKFMGSGMLPAGAYVTFEHEYILIFRKGGKREFVDAAAKKNRRESAYFWEERNLWFSDVWMDVKGQRQQSNHLGQGRKRSGAFPFELAYRLINMFSVKTDWVLDPFLGSGTTALAAMASGRNSIGFELDPSFRQVLVDSIRDIVPFSNQYIRARLLRHTDFVIGRISEKGPLKHVNSWYGFPVITSQETELCFSEPKNVKPANAHEFLVSYLESPSILFTDGGLVCDDHRKSFPDKRQSSENQKHRRQTSQKEIQLELF